MPSVQIVLNYFSTAKHVQNMMDKYLVEPLRDFIQLFTERDIPYALIGDIQDILLAQGKLDESYMQRWAKRLGVIDRLEDILKLYDEMI